MTDMDSGQPTTLSTQSALCKILLVVYFLIAPLHAIAESISAYGPQHHDALRLRAANTHIEFGRISSENGICRMNNRGTLLGYSGQTCLGTGRYAEFELFGEKKRVVNISLIGSGSNPGIRFKPRLEGRQTKALSQRGKRRLRVAGDLELTNASNGKHALTYLIMVNYE